MISEPYAFGAIQLITILFVKSFETVTGRGLRGEKAAKMLTEVDLGPSPWTFQAAIENE